MGAGGGYPYKPPTIPPTPGPQPAALEEGLPTAEDLDTVAAETQAAQDTAEPETLP